MGVVAQREIQRFAGSIVYVRAAVAGHRVDPEGG